MIMKKKILLSIALFVSAISFAQQIHFGVGGGITVYNMRGAAAGNLEQVLSFTDGIVSTGPVTGFYSGGYANIPLGNNLSVEPGLYYSTKGYAINGSYSIKGIGILNALASASLHSSYIEMPLLLKADFNGLQVFAGPQLSYLTNATIKTKAGLLGINLYKGSFDVSNQLNRWDAAITAGLGYQFTNGIRITAAYDRGLSKVDAGQNIKSYNQGFKIGAGMSF
jgi:opacity protein-like surface antigen